MRTKRKLVIIEWLDSHAGRGWQTMDRIEQASEPLYCRSVGWLVSQAGGCKIIVPHIAGERNGEAVPLGSGDLTIPNRAIVKMRALSER